MKHIACTRLTHQNIRYPQASVLYLCNRQPSPFKNIIINTKYHYNILFFLNRKSRRGRRKNRITF